MAFHPNNNHHNLSQEIVLQQQHFSEDDDTDNNSVLRTIHLPDHQGKDHWLNTAILRQQTNNNHHPHLVSLQTNVDSPKSNNTTSTSTQQQQHNNNNQWLSRSMMLQRNNNVSDNRENDLDSPTSSILPPTTDHFTTHSRNNILAPHQVDNNHGGGVEIGESDMGGGGGGSVDGGGDVSAMNWQNARYKAEVLSHPLYEQLLSAHVSCLRIATPVDQLPRIDAQLAQSQNVVSKYSSLAGHGNIGDDKELDQFMTHYVLLLCSFKEQLQQHVRVHAMEAVMACWEIEQSLQSLTGVSPGEGTGATMSDDDEDQVEIDANLYDGGLDGNDSMGFGLPTESERSLMERVRQELKHELKQGYKEKIVDIREEILRKRRAGKLPGDTTSVLKSWWQSHAKWPYPTEEDKARLVQETGLQLKQINNWFINQRKRNWHSNPSSSTVLKSKRKSNAGDKNSDHHNM
uniref:homeobox protein knotted-1-like 13 isoform X2 n=1 Tax=Erigeron canadensis TaxID=72917 RepID=UPI001CB972B8|nr:homeobox protein knotted-1-like 13 isoform X2 [Erigeron canadensis]